MTQETTLDTATLQRIIKELLELLARWLEEEGPEYYDDEEDNILQTGKTDLSDHAQLVEETTRALW